MNIRWDRDNCRQTYQIFDAALRQMVNVDMVVVCLVRNELNGERKLDSKAVYSEMANGTRGVPYMPRPFPKGMCKIVAIIPKDSPYEAPEFISTDAHQPVEEWSIKPDGTYDKPTGRMVEDFGYGEHNSTSSTTLGCGHILSPDERRTFVAAIQAAWANGETVTLEVG